MTEMFVTPKIVSMCRLVYLYTRYGSGVWGEGSGAQVTSQQRVEGCAEGGVGGTPIGLKVLCQVLACILQLVIIQDDVKHLLIGRDRRECSFKQDKKGDRRDEYDADCRQR